MLRASKLFAEFYAEEDEASTRRRVDVHLEHAAEAEEANDIDDAEAYFALALFVENKHRRRRNGATACYF